MVLDERSRHHLYLQLEETLGPEAATTLMEHLPPVGWADVATKRDIDALAVATKRDIDALAVATKRDIDAMGDRLRVEFHKETKSMLIVTIGANLTAVIATASLAFAAARLS